MLSRYTILGLLVFMSSATTLEYSDKSDIVKRQYALNDSNEIGFVDGDKIGDSDQRNRLFKQHVLVDERRLKSNYVSESDKVSTASSNQNYISIIDFGAVCDGIKDDTPAVFDALSTGKSVYIPRSPKGCVIGDLKMTNGNQRLFGFNSLVKPRFGASYVVRVSGYASSIQGLNIQDNGGVVTEATSSETALRGALSIAVNPISGPPPQVGQRYSIRLNNGSWATGFITGVSGSRITLRDPLPDAVDRGQSFQSTFGVIHIQDSTQFVVKDIQGANIWGGILVDTGTPVNNFGSSKGLIDNIVFRSVRMFGLVKGRNASDNSFNQIQLWGGRYNKSEIKGNGYDVTFRLPDRLFLVREIIVSTSNKLMQYGLDYSVSTDGLHIIFDKAPPPGEIISIEFQAYGHDGLVDDGRDVSLATGGNYFSRVSALQFLRCGSLKGAQLYTISQSIFDTCSEVALALDGTSQWGTIDASVGWAPVGLKVFGSSVGIKINGSVTSQMPASYAASRTAQIALQIEAGSDLSGRIYDGNGGWTDYVGGMKTFSADLMNVRRWPGRKGTLTLNADGDVLGFSKPGFNYISTSAYGAHMVVESKSGQVDLVSSSGVKVNVTKDGVGFNGSVAVSKCVLPPDITRDIQNIDIVIAMVNSIRLCLVRNGLAE